MVLSFVNKRNIASSAFSVHRSDTDMRHSSTREERVNVAQDCRRADCKVMECRCGSSSWMSDENVFLERMPNTTNVCDGDVKAGYGVFNNDIIRTSHVEGENFLEENEQQYSNIYQQQRQPRRWQGDVFANSICENFSFSQVFCGSPLRTTCGDNTRRQSDKGQQQHNQSQRYFQREHGGQTKRLNNKFVGGGSRRSSHRRSSGASAVETVQKQTLAGISSPQINTALPSLFLQHRGRKQRHNHSGKLGSFGDYECRLNFQIPLPRSRMRMCSTHDVVTPLTDVGDGVCGEEALVAIAHNASGSEPGAVAEAESNRGAFSLSGIASFYGIAVEQLVTECDQQVLKTCMTPCKGLGYMGMNSFNKQKSPICTTGACVFDKQSSFGYCSLSASSLKASFQRYSLPGETRLKKREFSMGRHSRVEESSDVCGVTESLCFEEQQFEAEGISYDVFSGGLFMPLGEERGGVEAVSTTVQQLIQSIGLYTDYGDASSVVLIAALVYVSRIVLLYSFSYSYFTSVNWQRLVAIAILIATKMYVDGSWRWNKRFAKALDLSVKEINGLELDFLFLADFNLLVREEELEAWSGWMESVACRHGTLTLSQRFSLGRSRIAPSSPTITFSPFAGDGNLSRKLTCTFPGNWQSTSLSFTSADMTPSVNAHVSPAALRSSFISRRSSVSLAQDGLDKQNWSPPPKYCLPSPLLLFRETPNSLPPSPLQASCPQRRTGRLFSIVHAPREPVTPSGLQQLSLLINNVPACDYSPTPPEQGQTSPVAFFRRTFCPERCNGKGGAHPWTAGGARPRGGSEGNVFFSCPAFDELDDGQTPPHRMLNILSPPNSSVVTTYCSLTLDNSGGGTSVNKNNNNTVLMNSVEEAECKPNLLSSSLIGG